MNEGVLIERIEGLKELFTERFDKSDEALTKIQTRVDLTNGRVKKLEIWRAYLLGAWAVISLVLLAIVIPLYNSYLEEKQDVSHQVENVMSRYLEVE